MTRTLLEELEATAAGLPPGAGPRAPESSLSAAGLSAAERHLLLVEWCDTALDVPLVPLVQDRVAGHARRSPQAAAVVEGKRRLTYGELDALANGVAHRLCAAGVGPEVRVAVLAERSLEMVVGALAVLKAGGGYVPIDPKFPRERQAFMLKDCGAPVALVHPNLLAVLPETAAKVLPLELAEIAGADAPPAGGAGPENVAYVIYTSGSTGQPKGSEIEHAALTRLLHWHQGVYGIGPEDRATLFSGPSFDVSVWEVWSCLAAGAALHIPDEESRYSATAMIRWLAENEITHGVVSTPLAELMIGEPWPERTALRTLTTGGDRLRRWLGDGFPCPLVNIYGPSEATVVTTAFTLLPGVAGERMPPIGRPLGNVRVYLLDPALDSVPLGAAGELWIGGGGLARDYLDRPALTAERFAPDPFAGRLGEPGARLYRTGDLARYLPTGDLEFLGRADFQIKIRGFRIEPGEIEAELVAHPGVREVTVLARADGFGDPRLVAYVVPADPGAKAPDLRGYLAATLPDYMVPSAFVWLDALPLTPNGKIDRQALAAIEVAPVPAEAYLAPRTMVEESLAGIWAELLGLDRVGIQDPFLHLGGHSLLAIQVLSRVRNLFGVELSVQTFLDARTIEGLARAIVRARDLAAGEAEPPLVPVPRDRELPLSFAQARLWFLDRLEENASAYHVPVSYRLRGDLAPGVLAAALQEVVRRHEALRTRFVEGTEGAVQAVDPPASLPLAQVDLTSLPAPDRQREEARLAAAEAVRELDLAQGPLFRALLLRSGEGEWLLVLSMHHIVTDGWSLGVLRRELAALYGAGLAGEASPLPELPVQYADFAVWQRGWMQGEVMERELAYWRRRLAGYPPLLELPTDRPRPAVQTFRGATAPVTLGAPLTERLRELSRRSGTPLFMTLMAAFLALLHRLSGQDDLLVGTPTAGRNRLELEGLIGFFVNTLVLRAELTDDPLFSALLARVREESLGAYAHGDLPFERVIEALAPERSLSHSPLFQVMFALQTETAAAPGFAGLETTEVLLANEAAKLDLTLSLVDTPAGLAGGLEHNTDLFDTVTVRRWTAHLETLLWGIVEAPGRKVSELPLLRDAESRELVAAGRGAAVPALSWPRETLLHELFERQAAATPAAWAVGFGAERLSYAELEVRANRLARHLRRQGVGPEVRVGLCVRRSAEMVVALLGILKAGGAYVPLDPAHPAERLALILADSGVSLLVAEEPLLAALPAHAARLVLLDRDAAAIAGEEPRPLPRSGDAGNLAYVLFTSGSTGRPKGVALTHRAVVNFFRAMAQRPGLGAADVVPALTTLTFDIAGLEIYLPLAVGGRVEVLGREEAADGTRLAARLAAVGATLVQATPATWRLLIEIGWRGAPGLRMLSGGEALPRELADELLARGAELWNVYGPTETAVYSSVSRVAAGSGPVLLGTPVANTDVYVADRRLGLAPAGIAGELLIGGEGVARGYLERPDLTAEKFIPHAWSAVAGERLYRTGDLVRLRPSGELEFLGRIDHQVKVRGFRIELGEIEAALSRQPGVQQAVVAVEGDGGDKRLIGYLVAAGEPSAGELRAALALSLPDYMIPAAFVLLAAFPLTPSGKVDRRALAQLAVPASVDRGEHVAPRTAVEERLAGVWSELLGLDRVGIRDDFFRLGGHSLLATQVMARIRRHLGVELELRTLFNAPTVEALARRIEAARGETAPAAMALPIRRVPRAAGEPMPLSFAQQRLWFLDQLEPGSPLYNVPAMFEVEGRIDVAALAGALAEIVRRHESLRTRFVKLGDEPVQETLPESAGLAMALASIDLSALPGEAGRRESARLAREEAALPFDLARGPLARFRLVRRTAERHSLFLSLHHIISDGWSIGVLMGELRLLYAALTAGSPPRLPELPVQYADFAVWQRGWLQGEVLTREIDYWRGRLGGAPTALDLPTDRPRPAMQSFRGGAVAKRAPRDLSLRIDRVSRQLGGTPFIVLMAAFQALLCRLTNQPDLSVGTPIANRTRLEIEGLIGFFVNTLVVRTSLAGNPSFAELAGRVREVSLEAHAHQDLPFERLVEALEPERSLSHSPLFQVMLVLQNAPFSSALPGLRLSSFLPPRDTAKFDLLLALEDQGEGLEIELEYGSDLFDRTTAARILGQLEILLDGALADPERRLWELPLLTAAARGQLLVEWNDNAAPVAQLTQAERFAAQAERTPGQVALTFYGQELTYAEVEARSNRLAHRLRRLGVGPGVAVGVCLARSLAVPVAVLAIFKAGGLFLPLDPTYPVDRLAFMLADAGAAVLLSQQSLLGLLPDFAGTLLRLEELDAELAAEPASALPASLGMQDLAYVIYTSGSTGRPKGIAMTHGALANLVAFHLGRATGAAARTLQFSPLSFDVCFQEIFSTWGVGGTVVLVSDDDRRDPEALLEILERERVGRLFLPFVALNHLAEAAERRGLAPSHLREVITAGEQLQSSEAIVGWFRRLGNCTLENQYGPSELHVTTSYPLATDPDRWPPLPPIGRSLLNIRLYLLDPYGRPVPVGVAGEIFLGGPQMARGYLGRADLTADRFVPDHVGGAAGERLYRSGDLARYLPDGNLEFLGRIDLQVKIRGFRIELGEVEAVLADLPGVREAAVLALPDAVGGKRLVAYVAPAGREEELRELLRTKLPDYMVPSAFVGLDALPVAATGKVDRGALARIEVALGPADGFVAPRTAVEELLAGIWAELLGRDPIGIRDDFFHLGGHSLLATQVLSRVRRLLGVELSIRTLFESPTVETLARQVERARDRADRAVGLALVPVARDRELPLSFAQARLWFLDRLQPGTAVYNLPLAWRLRGRLAPAALGAALDEIVRRHEALRTRFAEAADGPVQIVAPARPAPLPRVDLGGLPEPARGAEESRLTAEEARRPFDLARGPLLRALLLQLAEGEWVLLLAMHHVISDGWSLGVLARELEALYGAALTASPSPLPELPVQYADFAVWQRDWLRGEVMDGQLAYWRQRLAGHPPVLELPTDRPRPTVQTYDGDLAPIELGKPLAEGLRTLSRRHGTPLFMTLLAGFLGLLQRYTGQADLLVGTPTAGRNREELEGLIGFFVNTLVIRVDAAGDPAFAELLRRTRDVALGAYAHGDVPLDRVVEELAPERSLGHSPLFQVMFVLQTAPGGPPRLPGLEADELPLALGTAKFDLTVGLAESAGGLAGELEYNRDLFDATTARRLAEHLRTLLAGMVADPAARLSELPLLSAAERRELVVEWNATRADFPRSRSIHELFAAQARRAPQAAAVVAAAGAITYGELDARAAVLAGRLRAAGVGPEALVGLCVERSIGMVVAMLAILKAGGAYVPLDPSYPAERLAFLLADSGVRVLLAQPDLAAMLPAGAAAVLLLDGEGSAAGPSGAGPVPDGESGGDSLAYVIYTSGSTGRPKGVAVSHRAVLRLVLGADYVRLGPGDRVAQAANASFDAVTFEVWGPLLNGGSLAILPQDVVLSPAGLAAAIREQGLGAMFLTTALFNQVAREAPGAFAPLDHLLFGGEAVDPAAVRAVLREGPPRRLLHVYGPTESTTFSTWFEVGQVAPDALTVPIGKPLANTRAYVLDAGFRPVPAGVHGSLYLGGDGLARGYLNQPALTAERFVPDPFGGEEGGEPGGRLYATGDLVRHRAEGAIEFLGRADQQVKIRGFRIEPGEIEAVLATHPGVGEAAVLAREEAGGKRLVAYVATGGTALAEGELREYLKSKLPDYMIPSAFVPLEALPLTPNGKVDRKQLAEIDVASGAAAVYVPPRTVVEETLAGVWAELLGVPQVGIRDDFFLLGGHSLLGIQALSRVRRLFGVELGIRALFNTPTVEGLARAITQAGQTAAGVRLTRAPRDREVPLSFAQARLWFLDQVQPGTAVYNLPVAYRLRGALEPAALAAALREIVRRHEALRTRFPEGMVGPVQSVAPAAGFRLPRVDLSGLEREARERERERVTAAEALRPFDLARGPLLRAFLLELEPGDHLLLLAMHHIVSDGWSLGVLARELEALYAAALTGAGSPLPELPVQYADFAVWQREWMGGEVLAGQLAFWRERLAGHAPLLALPLDRPRPAVQTFRGADAPVRLEAEAAAALKALSRRRAEPLFMTVLAGFLALLQRYTGQDDLLLGTPTAGRNRVELEGLVGFFVNTLVLRADAGGDPRFAELIERAREAALGAYAHGDVPLDRVVEELAPERSLSHSPLFQVVFSLQTAGGDPPRLAGVEIEEVPLAIEAAKFDLTLALAEMDGGLAGGLEYNLDLFEAATVRRMAAHLRTLLLGAAARPEARLSELPLLSPAERDELVAGRHGRIEERAATPLVHELFAAHAHRRPEAVAVAFGDRRLSYGELESRSNRLAHALRSLGVGAEVRVGICAERTPERVVGIVAVLKAGGAYVSLDPAYPRERLEFLLKDAGISVLLTEERWLDRLPAGDAAVLALDRDLAGLRGDATRPPATVLAPESLAYVVYTSGSTGRPKGVAVPHQGLLNLVRWHHEAYGLTPEDRGTLVASPAFDAAVWELWPFLAAGAALHIPDEETRLSPSRIVRWWAAEGITRAFLPTPLAEAVLEEGLAGLPGELQGMDLRLRDLLVGGDRLHRAPRPGAPFRLVNHYGPSEYSVVTTAGDVPPASAAGEGAPTIGRPIANTRLYVLDAFQQLTPDGIPGELCIAGAGLARGYLLRPELTAERFLPDPWHNGERMYRTGDLVRWQPGGSLDFLGRLDHQVKIRGIRVELGEIEALLARQPGVREAAVVVRGDGRLVAFAVAAGAGEPVDTVEARLRAELPDYMVPAALVWLEGLPLTPNGKVDRRALERIEVAAEPSSGYVAPTTPVERALAVMWAELLRVERVGIRDDFFRLGGHSLLATQVLSRTRRDFGAELTIRALFESPTIEAFAGRVERAGPDAAPETASALVRRAGDRKLPLSSAQARLWFLDRLQPGSSLYNIPLAYRLRGGLEPAALAAACGEILRRHEALRTRFAEEEGGPEQVIEPAAAFVLPRVDLGGVPPSSRRREEERLTGEEARRPFDLARGPLFRALLLRNGESDWVLLLALHHIVSDGWSMGVMLRELEVLYAAALSGLASPLPELPLQYGDFAVWQRGWLRGEALQAQLAYWRQRLAGHPPFLALPTDRPRPAMQTFRGEEEPLRLGAEASAALRELSRRGGAPLFMTALAGFLALLNRYTGEVDLLVGTPLASRNRVELEGLIGFFVNSLVLRTDVSGDPTFAELLSRVRTNALEAYAHGDLPFERLVEELSPERSLGHSPLFQVSFSLETEAEPVPRLEGLEVAALPLSLAASKFDLVLALAATGGTVEGVFGYNRDLFEATTVRRFCRHFELLMAGAASHPDCRLSALPLLAAAERAALLYGWNDTAVAIDPEIRLHRAVRGPGGENAGCGGGSRRRRTSHLQGARCESRSVGAASELAGGRCPESRRTLPGALPGAGRGPAGCPQSRSSLRAAGPRISGRSPRHNVRRRRDRGGADAAEAARVAAGAPPRGWPSVSTARGRRSRRRAPVSAVARPLAPRTAPAWPTSSSPRARRDGPRQRRSRSGRSSTTCSGCSRHSPCNPAIASRRRPPSASMPRCGSSTRR